MFRQVGRTPGFRLQFFICCLMPMLGATVQADLSFGNRMFLEKGLQIQAVTSAARNGYFSQDDWNQAHFTGMTLGLGGAVDTTSYGPPGSYAWSAAGTGDARSLKDHMVPYVGTMFSWCYRDEQFMDQPAEVTEAAQWFQTMRADPRLKDIVFSTNQMGGQSTAETLQNYMAIAQPDMLSFDWYLWGWEAPLFKPGSPTAIYMAMEKYRKLGLAGNDGTGRTPIPYARYVQTFTPVGVVSEGYRISESEFRNEMFASWAFGFKMTSAFVYDDFRGDTHVGNLMFDSGGSTAKKTPEFYFIAETNRQSLNLGPTLVALQNRDVRIVSGPNSPTNHGVLEFAGTSDPFMKQVSATNLGTTNGGVRGDVLLGFFRPVLEELDGPSWENQDYFMIVNGLSWPGTSAADTSQLIRVVFDFGNSGITKLQRLSRDTGLLEEVSLIYDGGSQYHLDLTLPGGTGDLFKYDTGAPFVTAPEPGAAATLLLFAAAGLLRRARRAR